jgi:hypothetical protein
MGEVRIEVELVNTYDEGAVHLGLKPAADVRRLKRIAVADTGAVMMLLPQDLVEALGVAILRKAVVTYADERKEERPIAGPITVKVAQRQAVVECVVGPPTCEVLLGQIALESMDLLVDCTRRTLAPRPESPYLPMLNLK